MTAPAVSHFGPHPGDQLRQTVKRIVPTAANDKFVQVSLKPLMPVILATSILGYNEGRSKSLAEAQNTEAHSSWQSIVAESTLGYLILKHTSGIYPLLGLGLSVGRASRQDNALDQLKAVISTVIPMGMGFVGANLMDPDVLDKMDNLKLKALLTGQGDKAKELHLLEWLNALMEHPTDHLPEGEASPVHAMGEQFMALRDKLLIELPQLEAAKDKASIEKLKGFPEQLSELKASLAQHIGTVGEGAIEHAHADVRPIVQQLMERLANNQSTMTRFTRFVNPICCFMASAFLIGAPLANWINRKLEHRHPDLKKKEFKHVLFPESQRVIKPREEKNVHYAAGEHTYRVNSGDDNSCPPNVAAGRPMQ